jgi:hypothetical protein
MTSVIRMLILLRVVGSSDLVSKVSMNIEFASQRPLVGTMVIHPIDIGSCDLVSKVPTVAYFLQKDRF